MSDRKISRIEIEYDDGEIRRATGENAEYIWKFYSNSAEFYLHWQKRQYEGPSMEVIQNPLPQDEDHSVDEARVRRTLSELARGELF
jgi:hypothetical protein